LVNRALIFTEMDNYYLVYIVDYTNKNGKDLAKMADISDNRKLMKGFDTKAGMKRFYEEYKDAFIWHMMLKPIV
jgi:hypothetical protein